MNVSVMAESNHQNPGSAWQTSPTSPSDHRRLMDAGWSYRMTDDCDCILYHDYRKGAGWYSLKDAIAIMDGRPGEIRKR